MTTDDVRAKITALFDGKRTVAISKTAWFNSGSGGGNRYEFQISVIPGIDGASCQQWGGPALEDCVALFDIDYHAKFNPKPPEVAEE